jgi:dihydropteroate synthase
MQPAAIRSLQCGSHELELGRRTLIMGILNVTPDSFSDGGSYVTADAALRQAYQMAEDGADILDIGGESTRPGHQKVEASEELARVIPIIKAIVKEIDLPISIDTYKPEVARRSLEAGAHILNDIWGCRLDQEMAAVAHYYQAPIVLMHNRLEMNYVHFVQDVLSDLRESVRIAREAGVRDSQIILDPGIGFAKTRAHNLELMNQLDRLQELGYPVLLGTSRKGFIQYELGSPASDVVEGTAATVTLGIAQGCEIVRVHDVRQMKRVALMSDAIVRRVPQFG